jgi:hypothetical protein
MKPAVLARADVRKFLVAARRSAALGMDRATTRKFTSET